MKEQAMSVLKRLIFDSQSWRNKLVRFILIKEEFNEIPSKSKSASGCLVLFDAVIYTETT